MNLLLVSDAYPPIRKSVAALMSDLAAEVSRQGHQVTVVTLSSEIETDWVLSQEQDVAVLRIKAAAIKSWRLNRWGLIRRGLAELALSWRLWRVYRRSPVFGRSFDGVVWYSPTIFLGRFVAKVASMQGCPRYLVLRDIFPRWALEAGVLRNGLSYYVFRCFEKYQYRVASVIGVESPGNLDYFRSGGPQSHPRVEVLRNWVARQASCNRAVVPTAPYVLVFGGTMGPAQDMDNILRLAANLKSREDITIALVGGGSDVPRLKEAVRALKLNNVQFFEEMAPSEFKQFLSTCHVGLISLDRRLTSHNIPGKLLSYLDAGLPVVASVNPASELKSVIERHGAGYVYENGDDVGLMNGILSLIDTPAEWVRMSNNALELCDTMFSAAAAVRQIVHALESLRPGPTPRAQTSAGAEDRQRKKRR
jgi:glycosyltransferase involved in cell wall biosynthesis